MSHFNPALIVEDNALVAMVAHQVFEGCGCDSVMLVASLEYALEYARSEQISFALVVTRLEDGDTQPLVALLAKRNIPFAFVSDFPDGRDIPEQWRDEPFITKPYFEAELAELLEQYAPCARSQRLSRRTQQQGSEPIVDLGIDHQMNAIAQSAVGNGMRLGEA